MQEQKPKNHCRYTYEEALVLHDQLWASCAENRHHRIGEEAGKEIIRLRDFLILKTAWLNAPASSKYHLAVEGGLIIHSVSVAETALRLRNLLMPTLPYDSVVLCSLMHDVGKIFGRSLPDGGIEPFYLWEGDMCCGTVWNNADGSKDLEQTGGNYYYNPKALKIDPTMKNLLIPQRFVTLSDAEIQAIPYGDGAFVQVNRATDFFVHPLSWITHAADYWNGAILEAGYKANWLDGMMNMSNGTLPSTLPSATEE